MMEAAIWVIIVCYMPLIWYTLRNIHKVLERILDILKAGGDT
jgi:hypothetical protein